MAKVQPRTGQERKEELTLFIVDVEGKPFPGPGQLREFGAVEFESRAAFFGPDDTLETFQKFHDWIRVHTQRNQRAVFVSDNPAFDWQHINWNFWRHLGFNPFGHSARRIGDFAAGLAGDFYKSSDWKSLRVTKHDHHPVHDALGNVEALAQLMGKQALLDLKS